MRLVLTSLILLLTVNVYALGVSQVSVTPAGITIKHKGLDKEVSFDGFDVTQANADLITDVIQTLLDDTRNRNTLPHDDEDWISDPARANAFWVAPNKITYRNTLVTVFIENGLFNVRLETVDFND